MRTVPNVVDSQRGGQFTAAVTGGTTSNQIISAQPGRLCRALVTAAGTGSGTVPFYDNATTNSGTVIGFIPATITATGVPYIFDMPVVNGIVFTGATSGPALTVSYSWL